MSVIFLFRQIFLAQIWCMFGVVILLEKEGSPNQPMEWRVCVVCCDSHVGWGYSMNLIQIANSFSSGTSPGHDTASPVFDSGNNTCRTHTLVLSASHKRSPVWSKYFEFGLAHKTDFHSSDFQFLCFFAQAILFFQFITLSSGFFAAICPFSPALLNLLWTVNLETSLLLVAFNWACISLAVNRRFRRLVTRMNFSDLEDTVCLPELFWSSCVPVCSNRLTVLATTVTDNSKVRAIFLEDWPSLLKVIAGCFFPLLIWPVLAVLEHRQNQE